MEDSGQSTATTTDRESNHHGQPVPPAFHHGQPMPPAFHHGQPMSPALHHGQPVSPASAPNPNVATPQREPVDLEQGSASITSILRRWRTEDLVRRSGLVLRGLALAFSFLSFIIMATNKHGGWMDFDNYEEYRYCLSIATIAVFYTLCQVGRQIHELMTGKELVPQPTILYANFIGDQVMAYLLLSSSSAAVPQTDRFRENNDNAFTDMLSAATSMSFFAFAALAASSLVSGFKLSRQTYI